MTDERDIVRSAGAATATIGDALYAMYSNLADALETGATLVSPGRVGAGDEQARSAPPRRSGRGRREMPVSLCSTARSTDVLVFVEDPGAANYLVPIVDGLRAAGVSCGLLAGGFAADILSRGGSPSTMSPAWNRRRRCWSRFTPRWCAGYVREPLQSRPRADRCGAPAVHNHRGRRRSRTAPIASGAAASIRLRTRRTGWWWRTTGRARVTRAWWFAPVADRRVRPSPLRRRARAARALDAETRLAVRRRLALDRRGGGRAVRRRDIVGPGSGAVPALARLHSRRPGQRRTHRGRSGGARRRDAVGCPRGLTWCLRLHPKNGAADFAAQRDRVGSGVHGGRRSTGLTPPISSWG